MMVFFRHTFFLATLFLCPFIVLSQEQDTIITEEIYVDTIIVVQDDSVEFEDDVIIDDKECCEEVENEEKIERASWDIDTTKEIVINAEYIINQHIKNLGGEEKIRKIKTLSMDITFDLNGQEMHLIHKTIDDSVTKTEWKIFGQKGYSIATKTKGYSLNPLKGETQPQKLSQDDLTLLASEIDLQSHYLDTEKKGYKITLIGQEKVNGVMCYILKIKFKNGKTIQEFIDVNTFMIVKTELAFQQNGKMQKEFSFYSDYTQTPYGVKFPMKSLTSLGTEFIIKNIDVNVEFPEDEFVFPK